MRKSRIYLRMKYMYAPPVLRQAPDWNIDQTPYAVSIPPAKLKVLHRPENPEGFLPTRIPKGFAVPEIHKEFLPTLSEAHHARIFNTVQGA